MTAGLAGDAAEILERDYGIDAGEVLSMNVDTVETVTGGIQSDTPDFAKVVNEWGQYGQKTFSASFADPDGYLLSRRNPAISSNSTLGYYADVTSLPSTGVTTEDYYLTKRVRYNGESASGHPDGSFKEYSVKGRIPAGTDISDLLDASGPYRLTGAVFSSVNGGTWYANDRPDYNGWWGTGIFNPNEYDSDNIHARFHLVKGGTLNNGFAFMVNESESTYSPVGHSGNAIGDKARALSGYFISYSSHYNTIRTLWRIDNWRLDNAFSAPNSLNSRIWCYSANEPWKTVGATFTSGLGETATCLATWDNDATDLDYDITCKDGSIKILETENGVTRTVADVKDSTYTKGTYGFWGNNCEQADESMVSGLNVEISKTFVKSFGDIVYEPTWTEGALHMLINMDGDADRTMLGADGGRESSTRCHRGRVASSRLPRPARGWRHLAGAHPRGRPTSPGTRRRYWRGTTA